MKRIFSFIVTLFLVIGVFSGCKTAKSNADLKIVTTSFSAYDWTRNILGDNFENTDLMLISDNGVDMHSYQPTAEDIVKISTADIFIYVGGASDDWTKHALKNTNNSNTIVINMLDSVGEFALGEEIVEGMEHQHGEEDAEHGNEFDEHIWLSLKNAEIICGEIKEALCKVDNENAEQYNKNFNTYKGKLEALDTQYKETLQKSNKKPLVFADRFPFRYFTEDYKISYYACFPGCSTETDASFNSVIFLANNIDKNEIKYIFVIEGSDKKIAKTVVKNTTLKNQEILTLNSMQSVTKDQIENGLTYLSVMEKNISLIIKAL